MSSPKSLKSKNLLLVTPHFRTFIREQAVLIQPFFNSAQVILPKPHFSKLILRMPLINKRFSFLKVMGEANETTPNFQSKFPKFFTLPLGVIQKRNCYLISKSCISSMGEDRVNFDLIHAHFLDCGFVGAKLKALYNKPLVVTAHGGDFYDLPFKDIWYYNLARYVLNEADQVITVSKSNEQKLLLLGLSPKKIHVISNGYDDTLFKPMSSIAARRTLNLPLDKKILLSVGNLVNIKGHTYLLEAMNHVVKKRKDVILCVIGTGPLYDSLRKKTKRLNLGGHVFFFGGRKHEEIPLWMNACDIFVLPSLMESFGVVSLESMACGKPVIGTDVGGIPEVIARKDLGILVKPSDPKSLCDGIFCALDRVWMADVLIDYVKKFAWKNIVGDILKVYSCALENNALDSDW